MLKQGYDFQPKAETESACRATAVVFSSWHCATTSNHNTLATQI